MSLADIQSMKALKLANTLTKKLNNHGGYNIQNGLKNFKFAVADVDRNPIKIACVGDSVFFGNYSSDVFNTSLVSRLRTIMQNKYGNCGFGFYGVPYTGMPASTSKWALTGTWTYNSGNGVSGKWLNANGTGNTATITFTGTSCDLVYLQTTSGSTSGATVTIDGVTVATPNFKSAGGTIWGLKQSYTGLSSGSHTLVLTGASDGQVYIEGLIAYNPIATTPKGCYVHNLGTPTRKANEYALQSTTRANMFTPHLAIIEFSINDARASSTTYYSDMSSLITSFQNVGASVMLLPLYAINDTTTIVSNYNTMIQQMYQLCDQYNCCLVDINQRWNNDFTFASNNGLMGNTDWSGNSSTDAWHPSDKGHRDIANAIAMNLIGQI